MKKKLLIIILFMICKAEAQTSAFTNIDSLLIKGQYKKALQLLTKINPQTFLSFKKSGDIYYSIDDFKSSIKFYEEALSLKKDYAVQLQLASSYRKGKQYNKSINIYSLIIDKDSTNLYATYKLGKLHVLTNQTRKALSIFEKLTKKDVENANYWYQLANIYGKLGNGNKMINSFLKAYKNDTTHIKSVYKLGSIYKKIRKKDSSNFFIEKGLVLDKNHINLNKLKINNLYLSKKYDEAIVLLKHLDSLVPNELYTKKMLGKSHFYLEQFEEAKSYLEKAKKIDREDFKTYTYLGHVNRGLKNYSRARLNYYQATIKGKKKRHVEYFSLGLLYLEMEKPKMAIRMFQNSLKENSSYYKAKYQLAVITDATYKDKKKAYKLYDDYVDRFEEKDTKKTQFAKARLKEITKQLFLKGEKID